jgi:hypothetical protein
MSNLNKHSMKQWVRFISLRCCSFVKTVISSRRPLSTVNFLANEQLLVSRVSSFICNWDRQFARTFIFLCVIICTNIKRGLHNIADSLAILQTGTETSQTAPHVLTAHHSVYQRLAQMCELVRYSGKTAGWTTEKLWFDFFWGGGESFFLAPAAQRPPAS